MPDSIRVYRVRHFVVGGALLVLSLSVAELGIPRENSEGSQESKSSAVIRMTTRVVNVSLVVTDAQGNPVKDLTKNEVTLLDEGKPQVISFFSDVDDAQLLPTGPTHTPNTFTNVPVGKAEPPSVTILLFDALNSKWTSQGYGLHRVREFLRQLEPQDHIGLYLLSDDLKVLHDFREDASDLVLALDRYDEKHGKVPQQEQAAVEQSGANAALDHFLSGKDNRYRFALNAKGASAAYRRDQLEFACNMKMASLQQIARQLSGAPGRKSLIWVTDSVESPLLVAELKQPPLLLKDRYLLPCENPDEIERMLRIMNGAGIAVYPVSAEGLETEDLAFTNTASPVAANDANPGNATASPPPPIRDLEGRLPDPYQHMAMEELALRTGGRAYFNRNDLETGIRLALDDARFTYSLAYYPDHNDWRGEWRKIEVKVDRSGLKVLARNGYFAMWDVRPLAAKSRFEFLSELAASSLDSPQLPMSVHITASSNAKGPQLHAQVHLNPVSMLTLQGDGKWKGSFEVVFMQVGKKNKLLDLTAKSVDAELNEKEYANASQESYQLPADLKFMPGAVQLCVIVRDKLSDAAGSVHIRLESYAASLSRH